MKVTHNLNGTILTNSARDDVNFLITNKIGGYCLLGNSPSSRYQGVFLMSDLDMYKVIEDIGLVDAGPVEELINKFSSIKRKRERFTEEFFMPYGYDSLVYELDRQGEVEIVLDVRRSYDSPEFGRIYKISKKKTEIIVSYKYEKESMYLVIKSDAKESKVIGEWIRREYEYDHKRNTSPFVKYVYKALSLKASKVVFAFFPSKKQALEEANYVFNNLEKLKEHQSIYVSNINIKKSASADIKMAKKCAVNSLNKLVVNLKNKRGIFAGLPWFFQFWSRDELVSLKALFLNGQEREVKEILLKNIGLLREGLLPNITLPESKSSVPNADSVGWLFKRMQLCLSLFSEKEKERITKKLVDAIGYVNETLVRDGLVYSRPKETWMDSEWSGDTREGFRIEIQAFFLNLLNFAYLLTKDKKYFMQEVEMRELVRNKFWDGNMLADGLNDFTIRPNVFIAHYVYPDLLSQEEWSECFDNAVKSLWLNWGGFATIDKNSVLFCKEYTGEIPQSYHRGDSWFWLNNLAAISMHKVDKERFNSYIQKIVEESTNEILNSGAIGHHAELSSASYLESQGCLAQAWSAAMFIELVDELY